MFIKNNRKICWKFVNTSIDEEGDDEIAKQLFKRFIKSINFKKRFVDICKYGNKGSKW